MKPVSKFGLFCERALEIGWLIGVAVTPVFFNVYSSRVFEPDKLTTLRSLALVMAVVWLARFAERMLRGEKPLRVDLRTPMVLPALLTMAIYFISSLFSLVPYTSFVGSYQRLQGTFTLFGYLVLFFAVLTTLRTRAQLNRLITMLILSSLPVALYGIVQHNGLDPLPWAGDVQRRVASNMGNAIFVAAYLIMIVPLTLVRIVQSFRDILGREEARLSDILRASSYIFIVAVQLLTIWWARSRGPWLGLAAAFFLLPYLLLMQLQRRAIAEKTDLPPLPWPRALVNGFGFGFVSLLLAGGLFGLGNLALSGTAGVLVGGGLALLAFGGLWLYYVVERRGWRWLWIGWLALGLIAALGLLAINVPGPLKDRVNDISALNRMTRLFEWESGTGKVRILIWEGAMEMIAPHAPITFPDGSKDTFNALRPLIGYGPESMYVGYNSFYPPELGHYEARNASPDRSHNETLDSVIITGILGLGVYLFTFGSVFYWALRWLGLLNNRRQGWIYFGLMTFVSLALFILFWSLGHLYFFAVAIPLGVVVGLGLYLTWQAFQILFSVEPFADSDGPEFHPHALLISGIVTAVLAHFVEINFGIAIAATRTVFWTLAGLLVVLGYRWLPAREPLIQPEPRRRSRRREKPSTGWAWSVLALSMLALFLLGTLAFDFITNPERLTESGPVFWQSLTTIYTQQRASLGALMIIVFTGVLFGVVGLGEMDGEGRFATERGSPGLSAAAIYFTVVFLGFLIYGSSLAAFHARLPRIQVETIEGVVGVAMRLSKVLGRYYTLIFFVMITAALFLMGEERENLEAWIEPYNLLILPVGLLLGIFLIRNYSYDLIRADVVFKQGNSFANSRDLTQKQIGIAHLEQSIDLAPREDYYHLFLGKAYLELSQTLPQETPPEQREELLRETERVLKEARGINPLNTDHSANLARFYRSWSQFTSNSEQREELLELSRENYEKALTLSPNNAVLWNELAILYAFDFQNREQFQETISHSLDLDPEFEQTWMTLGDVWQNVQQDQAGAIDAYQEALALSPKNCAVRYNLGNLLIQESEWTQAIDTLKPTSEYCAGTNRTWDMYRLLAIAYYYEGQPQQALQTANQALQLAPEDQREVVEQLITAIQQPEQVEPPSEPGG